jgi:hypothetical protein
VIALLADRGMARLTELTASGITATAVSRLERDGKIVRLSRGLYQLPDAPIETYHLAPAIARSPPAPMSMSPAMLTPAALYLAMPFYGSGKAP